MSLQDLRRESASPSLPCFMTCCFSSPPAVSLALSLSLSLSLSVCLCLCLTHTGRQTDRQIHTHTHTNTRTHTHTHTHTHTQTQSETHTRTILGLFAVHQLWFEYTKYNDESQHGDLWVSETQQSHLVFTAKGCSNVKIGEYSLS